MFRASKWPEPLVLLFLTFMGCCAPECWANKWPALLVLLVLTLHGLLRPRVFRASKFAFVDTLVAIMSDVKIFLFFLFLTLLVTPIDKALQFLCSSCR